MYFMGHCIYWAFLFNLCLQHPPLLISPLLVAHCKQNIKNAWDKKALNKHQLVMNMNKIFDWLIVLGWTISKITSFLIHPTFTVCIPTLMWKNMNKNAIKSRKWIVCNFAHCSLTCIIHCAMLNFALCYRKNLIKINYSHYYVMPYGTHVHFYDDERMRSHCDFPSHHFTHQSLETLFQQLKHFQQQPTHTCALTNCCRVLDYCHYHDNDYDFDDRRQWREVHNKSYKYIESRSTVRTCMHSFRSGV